MPELTELSQMLKQLEANKTLLDHRICEVRDRLRQKEIEQRLDDRAAAVLARFKAGDYVVVGAADRLWWVNDGQLLEILDLEEIDGLGRLEQAGAVAVQTKRMEV